MVAGKKLCCDAAAGEVVGLVKKAMDDVKVTYRVGKESVCCPDAAEALAKKTGEKVVQLVAGQQCGGQHVDVSCAEAIAATFVGGQNI